MFYISNAFSANMLKGNCQVRFVFITEEQAVAWALDHKFQSCVGHADTARVVTGILKQKVSVNRATLELGFGDELLIAQYSGPRLPEGATSLPEGARIQWIRAVPEFLDFI